MHEGALVCVCVACMDTHAHTADEQDYSGAFCLNKEDGGSVVQIVIERVSHHSNWSPVSNSSTDVRILCVPIVCQSRLEM